MINCNKCGKAINQPIKKLENHMFSIEIYRCKKCRTKYTRAHYQIAAY